METSASSKAHFIVTKMEQSCNAIPSSISNISSLQTLALQLNSLSGTLPSTFGLQLPNLRKLYLSKNQLSGSIPSYLSNCSQLTRLELNFNQFIGPVPAGLGHLENLQVLYLENLSTRTVKFLKEPIPFGIGPFMLHNTA